MPFFFKNLCFQHFLRCYRINLYFHSNLSENFVDIDSLAAEVCHTRECEKKQAKIFSSLESFLFFQNLCFQQPLRCYRNDLVTSTVIVKIPCGFLWIVPWGLSDSIKREKIGQKLFLSWKFAFFSKNCVCNNFLGVTEIIV